MRGLLEEANQQFDKMIKRDLVWWNTMISSRGVHGSVRFGLNSKNQPNRVILIL
jgi:hypothetical protein